MINRDTLQAKGWSFEMHASMLEIYNEHIRDLLDPNCVQVGGVPGSPGGEAFYQPPSSYTIQHDASGNTTVQVSRSVDTTCPACPHTSPREGRGHV
jgi:hypothetical protein